MLTIQQLVAEGKIKEALELLPAMETETIMLKSRFNKNEKDNLLNIIAYEEYQREHNKIIHALLSLAARYRQENPPPPGREEPPGDPPPPRAGARIKVFVSYSHRDEAFKDALDRHLSVLRRSNQIELWTDRSIDPGMEWDEEIKKQLEEAQLVLLLISSNFLASEYIWETELTRAMERHHRREAAVVPIFIKSCDWHGAPFGRLQGLPRGARPIEDPQNDSAWTEVARAIRALVEQFSSTGRA